MFFSDLFRDFLASGAETPSSSTEPQVQDPSLTSFQPDSQTPFFARILIRARRAAGGMPCECLLMLVGWSPGRCHHQTRFWICAVFLTSVEMIFKSPFSCAAPIGALFCPEIRAFMGFGARVLRLFPKFLGTVMYYSNTKMAVNSC